MNQSKEKTGYFFIYSLRAFSISSVSFLDGTIRERNKVMRGLEEESTAQTMMDGMRIYYNFIRPHTTLDGKTSAQKANIESDEAKWLSLIKKASQHQQFETKQGTILAL